MRKHLNNPLVSGGLALLAGVFVYHSLSDDLPQRRAQAVDIAYHEEEEEPLDQLSTLRPIDPQAIQDLAQAESVRDAFARERLAEAAPAPVAKEAALETDQVTLQGLWLQGDRHFAIIDHQIRAAGETHKRLRVESITDRGVLLSSTHDSRLLLPGESWTYQYKSDSSLASADSSPAIP